MVRRDRTNPASPRHAAGLEWPTLALLLAAYLGWGAALYGMATLEGARPVALALLAIAFSTLHSSLQHEVLHGHPTRHHGFHELLVALPLGVFIPYRRFKVLHLRHHNNARLTDPYDDPESFYLALADYRDLPAALRALLRLNNTLLGRLTMCPAIALAGFLLCEIKALRAGEPGVARAWAQHGAGLLVLSVLLAQIAAEALGWTPRTGLADGLARTVEYLKDSVPAGIR